ncbi:MAG: chemotaxis protein CheW [Syntrophobacteraceae bacterium]
MTEFVAEAREHLGNAEGDLLAMENCMGEECSEILERLFRSIHSIKGGSGTFGFPAVMELSHAMESVLALFREGRTTPGHDITNALLHGVDKLKCMIDDIHSSGTIDCRSEKEKLTALLQESGIPSGNDRRPSPPAPESHKSGDRITLRIQGTADSSITFLPEAEQVSSALAMQHFVFAIRLESGKDLEGKQRSEQDFLAKLEEFGQCLATAPGGSENADPMCHYLFSTVLEPDLVGTALDIAEEQVQHIAPELLHQGLVTGPATPEPLHAGRTAPRPAANEKQTAPETLRVNVGLLDTLINLAGELVLGRNQLRQILDATVDANPELRTVIQNVNLVTSEMQAHILQMRMQPVRNIFGRMRRLVRDLGDQLEKEVEFFTEGGEVELDKSILEGLIDPIVHLLRNCVDHGLETTEERIARGKPAKGQIRLLASHEGGQVNITLSDDGRGMDTTAIVDKAVRQGLLNSDDARRMDEHDRLGLIFLPSFSTAKSVTNVSGRGVGMDVVKTNVERFGGHVDIESVPGAGTTIRIRIPLTLAIISSLIVGAANQRFAIPQVNVRELVCIPVKSRQRRIEKVGEAAVLRLREQLLPLVRLTDAVGVASTFLDPVSGEERPDRRSRIADRREKSREVDTDRRHSRQGDVYVVVLRATGNLFGLIVDELFDIEEIVVKPLSQHIRDCRCFAGSTIMGDGRVAMILDAAGIASSARLSFAEVKSEQLRRQANESMRHKSSAARVATLIFKGAPEEYFALPLSTVSRLEKITHAALTRIGKQEFINYCGRVLPLMRLDEFLPVSPLPAGAQEFYVIIPKSTGPPAGILISQVPDTVELDVEPDRPADLPRGLLGSAIVEGRITMFLDVEELLGRFRKEIGIRQGSGDGR